MSTYKQDAAGIILECNTVLETEEGDFSVYLDGVEVEIIGGPLRIEDETWWQVRTSEGEEGWVLSNFIATVTPEGTESP